MKIVLVSKHLYILIDLDKRKPLGKMETVCDGVGVLKDPQGLIIGFSVERPPVETSGFLNSFCEEYGDSYRIFFDHATFLNYIPHYVKHGDINLIYSGYREKCVLTGFLIPINLI
jgi:hypothetical protein